VLFELFRVQIAKCRAICNFTVAHCEALSRNLVKPNIRAAKVSTLLIEKLKYFYG